jgi:membrane protease YdiL (CAAX protease family)
MELETSTNSSRPILIIILTLIATFIGLQLVGPLIGFFVAMPFYPGTLEEMATAFTTNPTQNPDLKVPFYIMQAFGGVIGFILIPAYILKRFGQSLWELLDDELLPIPAVLTMVLVLSFMGVSAFAVEWNQKMVFPEFLAGWEEWAKRMEEQLAEMTTFLTTFDTPAQFILGFIIIAVIPGVGEEIVFRGIVQRQLHISTKNIHVAIWLSAAIFSAIHLQFYGFIPRMLLGALFGYLYYWSGSLWIPIVAHFTNNAITVTVLFLNQEGIVSKDITNIESVPMSTTIVSAVITVILVYLFKTFYRKRVSQQL